MIFNVDDFLLGRRNPRLWNTRWNRSEASPRNSKIMFQKQNSPSFSVMVKWMKGFAPMEWYSMTTVHLKRNVICRTTLIVRSVQNYVSIILYNFVGVFWRQKDTLISYNKCMLILCQCFWSTNIIMQLKYQKKTQDSIRTSFVHTLKNVHPEKEFNRTLPLMIICRSIWMCKKQIQQKWKKC